jgi:hypothetical protein
MKHAEKPHNLIRVASTGSGVIRLDRRNGWEDDQYIA